MRIVVVRFSSLGDLVILSSLFETIAREIEGADITLVTKGIYYPLYDEDPRLTKIITYPANSVFRIAWNVREEKYEYRIDAHRSLRSFFIRKVSGGKWILYRNLRKERRKKVASGDKTPLTPLYLRYNETVKGLVKKYDYKPVLYVSGRGESILRKHNIAGMPLIFAPFASKRGKEWDISYYAEVGKKAVKEGFSVLILGSRDERTRAEELRDMVGKGCYNFAGVFDLDEIRDILPHSYAVVGGDTGLLHMADALGVRCVFLYTSTHPSLGFAPTKDTSHILSPELDCQPCHIHGAERCKKGSFECLKAIKPVEVINALGL